MRVPADILGGRRLPAVGDAAYGGLGRGYRQPLVLPCDAGHVTNYPVRIEGPAELTLNIATALADADGVDLIASDQPVTVDEIRVALNVTVNGAFDDVADAVASIRGRMPTGVSIEILGGHGVAGVAAP
jgi:hypothetical protein